MQSEKILNAVTEITAARTQDSLEQNLMRSVMSHIVAGSGAFYRLMPGREHKTMVRTVAFTTDPSGKQIVMTQEVVKMNHEALAVVESQQRSCLTDEEGLTRVWLPVVVDDHPVALVELQIKECSPESEEFLHSVLHIYAHFLAVVRDNEYDSLTHLYNRKTFESKINRIIHSYNSAEQPILAESEQGLRHYTRGKHWLGAVDIDHFKRINDTWGHLYGDEVLLLMANVMRSTFREDDLLFRYGGEEFIVVLTPCQFDAARLTFERFRSVVAAYQFPQVGQVSVSIGFVAFGDHDYPSDVVEQADQALYYAKAHGRNRVCSYEELIHSGDLISRTRRESDQKVELF